MGKRTITVSDVTGVPIEDEDYVRVTLRFGQNPREEWVLELHEDEVPAEFVTNAVRRGIPGLRTRKVQVQEDAN